MGQDRKKCMEMYIGENVWERTEKKCMEMYRGENAWDRTEKVGSAKRGSP